MMVEYKSGMAIDYRKLLKDTIRGAVWDMDIPPLPGAVDEHGEETGCSPEELQVWLELALEVLHEDGEPPADIVRTLINETRAT
jgi:hypothetical protein